MTTAATSAASNGARRCATAEAREQLDRDDAADESADVTLPRDRWTA